MGVSESIIGFDQLPDSANVRVRVVAALLGCANPTVWRMARTGRLPAPRKFGSGFTAWNVGELRAFLASLSGGAA